jgi:SAM-dependent methyltransferase
VLGTGAFAVHQALLFRQWTTDVTLFAHTAPPLDDEQSEQLAARGITVVHGTVAGWEGTGARMSSGELVARQALVVAPLFEASSPVLESLGLRTSPVEMGGHVFGHQYEAGANGQTSVPGVWVAGNVGDLRAQVITSAAAGLAAGAAINADLVTADTQHAVERARVLGREAWEARYRSRAEGIWSGQPNAVLVAEVADLAPGTALDVGCGEGADAMWLAERGWQVTGVDISQVALDRAAAQGAARGLRVDWVQADLLAEPPTEAAFDLVTAHFMQLPTPERVALYDRLAAAVRPGGTLLLVGHHPLDMHTTIGRPHLPEMFFTAEELAVRLDPEVWQVQVVDARSRRATDPHGQQVTIRDAVLRACKR